LNTQVSLHCWKALFPALVVLLRLFCVFADCLSAVHLYFIMETVSVKFRQITVIALCLLMYLASEHPRKGAE
jgi:hypothetical protein